MSDLLTRHQIAVGCQDEFVILQVSGSVWRLHFPFALQISAAMKHEARVAKRATGLHLRLETALGTLHNATPEKQKPKRFMQTLPKILKAYEAAVEARGTSVFVKLGPCELGLPWEVCFILSQWIRLKGKEAKRNAGEMAHWSKVEHAGAVANGDARLVEVV